MSAGVQAVAFWGLKVPAGNLPTPLVSELPGVSMVRITMAAIDPSAKALEADQPKLATLKLMRRSLDHDDYEDESDEDEEDEEEDEEEQEMLQKASKKLAKKEADKAIAKALKAAEANAMEVDRAKEGGDSEDEDDDDNEFGLRIEEFVICTLDPAKHYQQTLDIVVGEHEEVFFKVSGNYNISLSGNYIVPLGQKSGHDDYSGEDSEDEDEDDYDLSPDEDELMNLLGDHDEEDELDDVETPRITEVESDDEKDKKAEKAEKKKLTKAEKKSLKRAAEEEVKPEEPKLSKKQQKKLKANDGKAVEAGAETSESKKKVQFAKPIEQGPTNSQKDTKKPAEKAVTPVAASPAKKVVQGVTIEDKKVGTGPVAKNGVKLGMRYIGKLTNGKVFDSNTKGKPFTFRLGKGEVIKGWDVGLVGMQVGGERRITIPAGMAYGKKALPGIPANSTLTFDVKLLEVK